MKNKLEDFILERKKLKDILLMTHIIAGYPSFQDNLKVLKIMEENGVDLVEIQFPFSEPIADGPIFSNANRLAIAKGINTEKCLQFINKIKGKFSFKILMMGYYNTVYQYGLECFCQKAKDSGVLGLIIADLPVKENKNLQYECFSKDLSLIHFITPTQSNTEIKKICQKATGFIYIIARKGVTGKKSHLNKETNFLIKRVKKGQRIPLALGFGLSSKEDLLFLEKKVDIAIIGTAILKNWEEGKEKQLKKFFRDLRE